MELQRAKMVKTILKQNRAAGPRTHGDKTYKVTTVITVWQWYEDRHVDQRSEWSSSRNRLSKRYRHPRVHRTTIHSSRDAETT